MKTKQQNPPQINIVCVCVCLCVRAQMSVCVLGWEDWVCEGLVYRVYTNCGVYRFCHFIHLDPSVNYWRMRKEVYWLYLIDHSSSLLYCNGTRLLWALPFYLPVIIPFPSLHFHLLPSFHLNSTYYPLTFSFPPPPSFTHLCHLTSLSSICLLLPSLFASPHLSSPLHLTLHFPSHFSPSNDHQSPQHYHG